MLDQQQAKQNFKKYRKPDPLFDTFLTPPLEVCFAQQSVRSKNLQFLRGAKQTLESLKGESGASFLMSGGNRVERKNCKFSFSDVIFTNKKHKIKESYKNFVTNPNRVSDVNLCKNKQILFSLTPLKGVLGATFLPAPNQKKTERGVSAGKSFMLGGRNGKMVVTNDFYVFIPTLVINYFFLGMMVPIYPINKKDNKKINQGLTNFQFLTEKIPHIETSPSNITDITNITFSLHPLTLSEKVLEKEKTFPFPNIHPLPPSVASQEKQPSLEKQPSNISFGNVFSFSNTFSESVKGLLGKEEKGYKAEMLEGCFFLPDTSDTSFGGVKGGFARTASDPPFRGVRCRHKEGSRERMLGSDVSNVSDVSDGSDVSMLEGDVRDITILEKKNFRKRSNYLPSDTRFTSVKDNKKEGKPVSYAKQISKKDVMMFPPKGAVTVLKKAFYSSDTFLCGAKPPLEVCQHRFCCEANPKGCQVQAQESVRKLDQINCQIQIKQGWVYFPKKEINVIKNNQSFIAVAQSLTDNLYFDQLPVFLECIRNKKISSKKVASFIKNKDSLFNIISYKAQQKALTPEKKRVSGCVTNNEYTQKKLSLKYKLGFLPFTLPNSLQTERLGNTKSFVFDSPKVLTELSQQTFIKYKNGENNLLFLLGALLLQSKKELSVSRFLNNKPTLNERFNLYKDSLLSTFQFCFLLINNKKHTLAYDATCKAKYKKEESIPKTSKIKMVFCYLTSMESQKSFVGQEPLTSPNILNTSKGGVTGSKPPSCVLPPKGERKKQITPNIHPLPPSVASGPGLLGKEEKGCKAEMLEGCFFLPDTFDTSFGGVKGGFASTASDPPFRGVRCRHKEGSRERMLSRGLPAPLLTPLSGGLGAGTRKDNKSSIWLRGNSVGGDVSRKEIKDLSVDQTTIFFPIVESSTNFIEKFKNPDGYSNIDDINKRYSNTKDTVNAKNEKGCISFDHILQFPKDTKLQIKVNKKRLSTFVFQKINPSTFLLHTVSNKKLLLEEGQTLFQTMLKQADYKSIGTNIYTVNITFSHNQGLCRPNILNLPALTPLSGGKTPLEGGLGAGTKGDEKVEKICLVTLPFNIIKKVIKTDFLMQSKTPFVLSKIALKTKTSTSFADLINFFIYDISCFTSHPNTSDTSKGGVKGGVNLTFPLPPSNISALQPFSSLPSNPLTLSEKVLEKEKTFPKEMLEGCFSPFGGAREGGQGRERMLGKGNVRAEMSESTSFPRMLDVSSSSDTKEKAKTKFIETEFVYEDDNVMASKPAFQLLIRKVKEYSLVTKNKYKKEIYRTNTVDLNFLSRSHFALSSKKFNKQEKTNIFSVYPGIDLQVQKIIPFLNIPDTSVGGVRQTSPSSANSANQTPFSTLPNIPDTSVGGVTGMSGLLPPFVPAPNPPSSNKPKVFASHKVSAGKSKMLVASHKEDLSVSGVSAKQITVGDVSMLEGDVKNRKTFCFKQIHFAELFISFQIPTTFPLKGAKLKILFEKKKDIGFTVSNDFSIRQQITEQNSFASNHLLPFTDKKLKKSFLEKLSSISLSDSFNLLFIGKLDLSKILIFNTTNSATKSKPFLNCFKDLRNLDKEEQIFTSSNISFLTPYTSNIPKGNVSSDVKKEVLSAPLLTPLSGGLGAGTKKDQQSQDFFQPFTSTIWTKMDSVKVKQTVTKILVDKEGWISTKNPVTLTSFFSPYKGEVTEIKPDSSCLLLTDLDQISYTVKERKPKPYLGQLVRYGEEISENVGVTESGQIIQIEKNRIKLRCAQPILFSSRALLHVDHGNFVEKNSPLLTFFYQRLQTGDIVQGIPKIEQLFEARRTKEGEILANNLLDKLDRFFNYYKQQLNHKQAVRKSFQKIQQILVENIQRVYLSQGVSIADKHLEIVVKQMTSKVQILEGNFTSFLPGELIDLNRVENDNLGIKYTYLGQPHLQAEYKPIILGITKASLETESFISAASFQETTRILSGAAIKGKTDFLRGLKERVILGDLIPAGTGCSHLFDPIHSFLNKEAFPFVNNSIHVIGQEDDTGRITKQNE